MSYSLNSLKGGYIGHYIGITLGDIKGDTRSLDYSSYINIYLNSRNPCLGLAGTPSKLKKSKDPQNE